MDKGKPFSSSFRKEHFMPMRVAARIVPLLPGTALSIAVTLVAVGLEYVEVHLFGRAWLESLVLAILIGTAVRSALRPDDRFSLGIRFSAKTLLEIAVVLLGASVSARAVMAAGPMLLFGIVGVVLVAITVSYGIGRLLGLEHRLATLVACGNSICGNSAIVAAAPVIGATAGDVAASIAFTAVLGVVVVLLLPALVPLLHLSATQYGVLAGLTVYAVPQVIAATAPVATLSVHVGTLVKLVRVLMLGPVVVALSLGRKNEDGLRPRFGQLVPLFIVGFLALMVLRSLGALPAVVLGPAATVATWLTVVSMAALGLGVDVRTVAGAGGRVTATAVLSLVTLGTISFMLIRALGLA
jgi:uncharacterized integral membrane protein (TIGR00698 family)